MGSASPGAATPARFTFPPARDPVLQHCVFATAKGSVEAEQLGWDAQQGWRKGGGIVQDGMASPYTPQGQRISDQLKKDLLTDLDSLPDRYRGLHLLRDNMQHPEADRWVRHYLQTMIRNLKLPGELVSRTPLECCAVLQWLWTCCADFMHCLIQGNMGCGPWTLLLSVWCSVA